MAGAPQCDGGFSWNFAEFSATCRMSQPRYRWEPSVLLEMVCNLLCRFLEKHFRDRCDGNHRNLEKDMRKCAMLRQLIAWNTYYFLLSKTNMWCSSQVLLDQPSLVKHGAANNVLMSTASQHESTESTESESTESAMRLRLIDPVVGTGWVGNMQHPPTLDRIFK